jgi:enoyl-CoA hydratase/carnithine racemase
MSPDEGAVLWDRSEFVGVALIDRPARRNALNAFLCDELRRLLGENRDVRAL